MNEIYTIATTQPAPSMSKDRVHITACNYRDAVRQTRESWLRTRRHTTLHSGKYAVYYWHMIHADGAFIDRNFNSGVPASGRYATWDMVASGEVRIKT